MIGAFRLDVSMPARVLDPTHVNTTRDRIKVRLLVSQQQSKLEKADILEMTVKHLQNIQSNKLNGKELVALVSGLMLKFGLVFLCLLY